MKIVKWWFCFVIRWTGIAWLIHQVIRRGGVSIIAYHNPPREVVEKHLAYLSKRYTFITLNDLVTAIEAKDFSDIPSNAVVITIDDGYQRNAELVDAFRRYGVRPTIFICTQVVGTHRQFWFHATGIDSPGKYKALPTAERLKQLKAACGFDPEADRTDQPRQALSLEEIHAMQDVVDFQSHTRTHPILPACSDDESRDEIALARQETEAITSRPCNHFSYPNGDYLPRDRDLVEQAGYRSARTTDLGWNRVTTDPFLLKMVSVSDHDSVTEVAGQMTCLPLYLLWWAKRLITSKGRKKVTQVVDAPQSPANATDLAGE